MSKKNIIIVTSVLVVVLIGLGVFAWYRTQEANSAEKDFLIEALKNAPKDL